MEPVGLLLAECSEELPDPPSSPHRFLRFLLDNLLLAMALVIVKSALAIIFSLLSAVTASGEVASDCHG
jgi:uncharacterized RDD family membrane protein YckC